MKNTHLYLTAQEKYCLQYDFAALQIDHQFTVQSYNKLFRSVCSEINDLVKGKWGFLNAHKGAERNDRSQDLNGLPSNPMGQDYSLSKYEFIR